MIATTLGVAALSLIVWVLAMFGPGTTVVHQGSYATMLLLFAGLAMTLGASGVWLGAGVLVVHAALFAATWIFTTPDGAGSVTELNYPMAVVAIVALCGLIGLFALSLFFPPQALVGKSNEEAN